MNSKISNPKVEVSKGIGFNDKDYITWLLNILKEMEKNYVIMMSEASNEKLYDKYMECFIEMAVLQREVLFLQLKEKYMKKCLDMDGIK